MEPEPPAMFDVRAIIDRSLPRPAPVWVRWVGFGLVVGVIFALLAAGKQPYATVSANAMAGVVLLGGLVLAGVFARSAVRARQEEQARVEQIEQMVTLRQWPVAAVALHALLLGPMKSQSARVQSLVYLSSVLSRYHRFGDAADLHQYLLSTYDLDRPLAFTLRVARAMAFLREDRLVDADRAIGEIRRMDGAAEAAAYALVMIYRDVKTGHSDEAIEIFESRRHDFARQLSHRSADAHLLAACAYDQRGRFAEAEEAFAHATLLAPIVELTRRYPEAQPLLARYTPSEAPPEAR